MLSDTEKLQQIFMHLDPNKTVLVCGKHNYAAGGAKLPSADCNDCWFAFLFHHISQLPPKKQKEKLDELEMILRVACEEEDKGIFDFKPYRHPKVTIEKGAAED